MFQGLSVLEKGMDVASLRQRLISNNIANVDTPGYQRQDVTFAESLRVELAGRVTHPAHLKFSHSSQNAVGVQGIPTRGRNDGNNVDIEGEMAELAKNALYFQALSRQTSQYLGNLKRVISEGRR